MALPLSVWKNRWPRWPFVILALAIGYVAFQTYMRFGTIEPCGILRQVKRENAGAQGSLERAVAAAAPDSVIDRMLALQYGPLTPGKCLRILSGQAPPSSNPD